MKIVLSAFIVGLILPVAVMAEEKAAFNPDFEYSIFPLQDQVRYYGKQIPFAKIDCGNMKAVGIYNLRTEEGEILYDCVGYDNADCGNECFHDGIRFGSYAPAVDCPGNLSMQNVHDEDGDIYQQEICQKDDGLIVWQRLPYQNYVFNNDNQLVFLRDATSFTSYRNHRRQQIIIHAPDELMFWNKDIQDEFFHVKYERDESGRIISEIHFNKDGFPYSIYNAEYQGEKCVRIIKTDDYRKTQEYEFE